MITGADVIEYRARRYLSRKALATECGLTEGKIWRIENKNVIHADELRALELVGVTPTTDSEVASLPPTPTPPPAVATKVPSTQSWVATAELVSRPVETIDVDLAALAEVAQAGYDRYVSNSELQTFKRCRRKWWLAWHRGLHPRHESPVGPRQVGDRGHRALKSHYRPEGPADLLAALEAEIVLDRSALSPTTDGDVLKQFESEADLERIILEGYLAWLAETGADAELEIIAPETYLEAHLPELDFLGMRVAVIGKLDVRVRRRSDGVRLFIDHKFVGDLRAATLMLTLDEQMLHYHLLEELNRAEGEPRTGGALYNMLRRVKRTQRATPPFYQRVEVRHNDRELASYRERVNGEIKDIIATGARLDNGTPHNAVAYPRPTRDCAWDCPFLAVCPMFDDGSRAEDMLAQYFVKSDPLDYYLREMIGVNESDR